MKITSEVFNPPKMLNDPLRYLKGVGPQKAAAFESLGVYTIKDLLYYFPFRYEDRRNLKKIRDLKEGEPSLMEARVLSVNLKKIPPFVRKTKVKSIFKALLEDSSGQIQCTWFNQHYLADIIKKGEEIIVYGKPIRDGRYLAFNSPEYELVEKEDSLNLGRIVSVYRLTPPFNQKFLRKVIAQALAGYKQKVPDPIPYSIRKEYTFLNIAKSLEEIHHPSSFEDAEKARERFIFEELFFSQLLVYLRKAKHRQEEGIPLKVDNEVVKKIRENFSFELTPSQEEVLSQIMSDFSKSYPMQRLLQGDVGCGKTVVAAFAMGICAKSGFQAALMVPTEVLAYQHKETLDKMFSGLGFKIGVLTSSLEKKEIDRIHEALAKGEIDIIVGTHSLIQEKVKFKKLGLVVIDEQHKFGVAQRALLPKKGEPNPHCLVMSATPIPRTLALSLYGDLDLSVIKELPRGRISPETKWVLEKKRKDVYKFMKDKLEEGRQVYVVYPVIEESEIEDLKSLEEMHEKLAESFSSYKVGVFHGQMKGEEKLKVIKKFRDKKIDILVSTTVVEVGVNIENATTMVVENPERFGLAQLHQLRGRVRRSTHKPFFILLSKGSLSETAQSRLEAISSIDDGFKIAEEDLKLRGPGDFFGSTQHGVPCLKIANPLTDLELLQHARTHAFHVIKSDPHLEKPQNKCIRDNLDFWFK
ncbi:MAG: ATP-dependent DNA helicase RecG [Candidatus Omnitrophota bacterium]|nr:MAG: ATP-dependent DNA helicase RecG [Candidatus Omnitrophota bacterium]